MPCSAPTPHEQKNDTDELMRAPCTIPQTLRHSLL